VLALLARYGESSGYELTAIAKRGVGHVWAPARSRVYATLPRLAAAGLTDHRQVEQQQRPDKQLYRITAAGEEALRAWLQTVEPGSIETFLLRVFFGDLMSPEALLAHVEQHRADAAERLAEYEEIEREIAGDERARFGYMTLRWGLEAVRGRLRWAEEVLADVTP
jgi:PadR family transcriptional regulator, regulatory protein AphA